MLRGCAPAKVDGKGRLKLPATFRSIIEPKYGTEFFVTSLRGESVRIYPMEVWMRIEERLGRASPFNASVMRFKNNVNFFGQTATMDAQGRILIHPLLRERAATRGEVYVLGLQDLLDVWNLAAFEEKMSVAPLTDDDLGVVASLTA